MPHYHIDDNLTKAQGVNGDLDWLVIDNLCKPIDDDKDWIIVVSLLIY